MLEDRQLSRMFLRKGIVDEATLERAQALCTSSRRSLYDVLLQEGWVDEERAIVVVSKQLNLPCVSLKEFEADPRILELVPGEAAERLSLMPLGLTNDEGEKKLFVAMMNPLDLNAIEEVGKLSGFPVKPLLAGPLDIAQAVKRTYSQSSPKGEVDLSFVLDDFLEDSVSKLMDDYSALPPSETPSPSPSKAAAGASMDLSDLSPSALLRGAKRASSAGKSHPETRPVIAIKAKAGESDGGAFSLDFGDLDLSVKRENGADVYNRMTLPAGTELPPALQEEVPKAADGGGFTRVPTVVREGGALKEARQGGEEKQALFDLGDDWGDLNEEESAEVFTGAAGATSQPISGRTENSRIRYVADPNLQSRAQGADYLADIGTSDLLRAVVRVLVRKGVMTEEQIREEVRRSRGIGGRRGS